MSGLDFSLDELWGLAPYSLDRGEKRALYRRALSALTRRHYQGCPEYRRILDRTGRAPGADLGPEDQPMLPVRLFKELDLRSVPEDQVVKTMTSSGTSGQRVSKIHLDKENVSNQTKALVSILSSYIGTKRLPLVILDSRQVLRDRTAYSARGAGIVGFSSFGRDVFYALDGDMNLDAPGLTRYLQDHDGPILFFGYTYMIWQHVVQAMRREGLRFQVPEGRLFHIGGWKRLKDQAVDATAFNGAVRDALGNVQVHNYYGMAEQLGSVFVECERGHMHCSNFSDVIIRSPLDFAPLGPGKRGLIELLSLLPTSYPGHVLLTEDEGEILGEDDCPCGRLGRYFKIHGRVRGAELRGCSDTYGR